jgi:hypothetical protein
MRMVAECGIQIANCGLRVEAEQSTFNNPQ